MFAPATYAARRRALAEAVEAGLIVLLGNDPAPMNYAANAYPFRQDGTFLYYVGLDGPGLAVTLDAETGEATLYGHDPTLDDVIWEGPLPPLAERAAQAGIEKTASLSELEALLRTTKRGVHFLEPYRGDTRLRLGSLFGMMPGALEPSELLAEAVIAQRLVKTDEEVQEIERAVEISAWMHRMAMRHAQPGRTEREVAAAMEGVALARGRGVSFQTILTRCGEVLHNHPADTALQAGDLMLADAGAVSPGGYAGDLTRVSPVGGRFSEKQRAVYATVLRMQEAALAAIRPGVLYRDVHLLAAKTMVEQFKSLGLMTGDTDEAVAAGAHALFFPHGLGHALGLDVHDMEGLDEDRVGYDEEVQRSSQFGLAYLRFGRRLQPGYVLTVEPGAYFIGPLFEQWRAEGKHAAFLHYDEIAKWQGLGGVRIEDDVVVTADGCRVLGPSLPKVPEDVEAEVKAGAA
ncbi:MAG TPA: aminopeptidase P family protein [Rubricoccaceae bacterium]|nr:aminopeptidase P family protein [Rubricoccaceae bacterium]